MEMVGSQLRLSQYCLQIRVLGVLGDPSNPKTGGSPRALVNAAPKALFWGDQGRIRKFYGGSPWPEPQPQAVPRPAPGSGGFRAFGDAGSGPHKWPLRAGFIGGWKGLGALEPWIKGI